MQNTPTRQIRAIYDDSTIRVYQAYNDHIANSALDKGTFVSPPFKMERMTWIKPSFLWMMYRSGWAQKDEGQNRILAIDISRVGFEWALAHGLGSKRPPEAKSREDWEAMKKTMPVRIQWDPERNLNLEPLSHRAIQIGLTREAVKLYCNEWITRITDVTELSKEIHELVLSGDTDSATSLLPGESPYPIERALAEALGISD